MIRVLIADDSVTVRKAVADHLRSAGMDVVGEAADGREAVTETRRLRPDVVLMDVVMPHLDGLSATRRIMVQTPTPIVILSAHASQQQIFRTYDALAAGALDVCAKPSTGSSGGREEWEAIARTVQAASQVLVARLMPSRILSKEGPRQTPALSANATSGCDTRIVVMGASTGGPSAIYKVLKGLPQDFPLPIVLALHCSGRLAGSLAGWLNGRCALNVVEATDGDRLPRTPGTVIVVPPSRNLRICGDRTVLHEADDRAGCVPSVDELFTSAADACGRATIGVLLTGMGEDGAQGLKRIRDRGGHTIAQDESSCVVFGMPAAAIKLGAAEQVVPLGQIAQRLILMADQLRMASESVRVEL
ncbi:MAG: chemotaxis-specific protein-glutamate methyltransferase CheB [bacterium]|nr:chemotaxis-specific protein-glutamate methyltransferase CheB [bacterium]